MRDINSEVILYNDSDKNFVEQTKNDKNELLKNVSNKIDDMFTKH
jgi:hypothetical protein